MSNEELEKITKEEVRRAIARLKTGKATGVCGIQEEVLKVRVRQQHNGCV